MSHNRCLFIVNWHLLNNYCVPDDLLSTFILLWQHFLSYETQLVPARRILSLESIIDTRLKIVSLSLCSLFTHNTHSIPKKHTVIFFSLCLLTFCLSIGDHSVAHDPSLPSPMHLFSCKAGQSLSFSYLGITKYWFNCLVDGLLGNPEKRWMKSRWECDMISSEVSHKQRGKISKRE